MRVVRGLARRRGRPLCLAIGAFDGVHLGHQAILREAVALARECDGLPAALTFEPHPDAVLSPAGAPPLLTTLEEKLALLREMGLAVVMVAPFTRSLADTPPDTFVQEILLGWLHACCVVVGKRWRFGAGGRGDVALLEEIGRKAGLRVRGVEPVICGGRIVSSTRIRALLQRGRIAEANALLGREYCLQGEVVPGDGRGRQLGFPTANLLLPGGKLIPADGVYACLARTGSGRSTASSSSWHPAVASIGVRPTFEQAGERRVEIHLLSPPRPRELRGHWLAVRLVARLRRERRFPSAAALVAQMQRDCEQARQILSR